MPFVLLNEPFCNTGYQLVYKTSVFVKNRAEKKNKDTFAYLAFTSFKTFTVLDFEQTTTPLITSTTSGNVLRIINHMSIILQLFLIM
jgi:hypothetical protein